LAVTKTEEKMETDKKEGQTPPPTQTADLQWAAWAQIESGRYQPRRIRGSCRGRELG
jgi:hypothetical protein